MAHHLHLYPRGEPYALVETVERLDQDTGCTRCDLHRGARSPCLTADGKPGGLLVIGDGPTELDDRQGRPFMSSTGMWVREQVEEFWKGPVVWDLATRCPRRYDALTPKRIDACRPYLGFNLRAARPVRVVALGSAAYQAVTGDVVPQQSVVRAYRYLYGCSEDPAPCYYLPHPASAQHNPFIRKVFSRTLKWALKGPLPESPPTHLWAHVCVGPSDTDVAVAALSAEWAVFDIETFGDPYRPGFRILSLACSTVDSEQVFTWDEEALEQEFASPQSPLAQWFEGPTPKVGHFRTFDCTGIARRFRVRVRGPGVDTRIWHKLLNAHATGVARLEIVAEQAGMGGAKAEMEEALEGASAPYLSALRSFVAERKKVAAGAMYRPSKKTIANRAALDKLRVDYPDVAAAIEVPPARKRKKDDFKRWAFALIAERNPALIARYNALDCVSAGRSLKVLRKRLEKNPGLNSFREAVVDRAERAIERVQYWGIPTDTDAALALDRYLTTELEPLQRWFDENGLDPHKSDQVSEYLYTKLGIKPPKILDSGHRSSDGKVLEGLVSKHPVVQKILDYRKFDGFRTKYARGLIPHVVDGRIHSTIWLDGARSGRTSVSDPPLQQIPKYTELGKMARAVFAADPGFKLLSLDYSQLELRVAALLSGDPAMVQIFADGVDYHKRTAELIARRVWGIDPSEVGAWERAVAKIMNFSLLYGAGDKHIAETLSAEAAKQKPPQPPVSKETVALVRAAVLGNLRELDRYIKEAQREAMATGEVRTWWDGESARIRQLWDVGETGDDEDSKKRRSKALRAAFNTKVQGTANDFCVASMATLVEWIEERGIADDVQLVLPVHDQLIFHVRDSMVDHVAEKADTVMRSWNSGVVRIEVDREVGHSWGSLEKMVA